MAIRTYHDFVVVADDPELDERGSVRSMTVTVYSSPLGHGDYDEKVVLPEAVPGADGESRPLEVAIRRLQSRHSDRDDQMRLGEVLGALLLPPYARELLLKSLAWLRDDEGLRLRLQVPHELAHYPWEYMLIQRTAGERMDRDFLALDPRISIVRHAPMGWAAEWFPPAEMRRIVVAMASPTDVGYPKLDDLPRKQRAMKRALARVPGIDVTYLPDYGDDEAGSVRGARLQDILLALREPVDIFHFSGHARFDIDQGAIHRTMAGTGSIVLSDDDNLAVPVPGQQLAEILRSRGIRMAVVDACESARGGIGSSVATCLLQAGIPAVIAFQFTIYDDLAAAFTGAFYEALVAGVSIDEAVSHGRKAIRARTYGGTHLTERDWGVPVLYLSAGGGRVFNPVQDKSARRQAASELQPAIDLPGEPGGAGPDQIRGPAPIFETVQVEKREAVARVDRDVEGLSLGGITIDFKGGTLVIMQPGKSEGGVMVGSLAAQSGTDAGEVKWHEIEELLRAGRVPAQRLAPGPSRPVAEKRLRCPQCELHVDRDWSICPFCGAELEHQLRCPTCEQEVQPDWAVCPFCGAVLKEQKRCPNCGEALQPDWRICPVCSTRLKPLN